MNPMRCTRTTAVAALAAALLVACSPRPSPPADSAAPATAAPASAPASAVAAPGRADAAALPDFTALVERVGPAVVNVTTRRSAPARTAGGPVPGDPLFEFFRRFMPPGGGGGGGPQRSQGVGSGFVIDAEGHILTNAHVVADADEVTVRLADSKREYRARVVGSDPQTDVALLKVDAKGLPVAPIGDSSSLRAGEWVAAIGSPFGLANTITAGIVSATERALPDENYVPFIQTDVAVNPGNSGGPLLNRRGEVVGINSQIYSRTGGYMGLSFAIPIGVAMQVAEQLRTQGHVTRGRLGITIQELSPELARSFGLDSARGALVSSVEPGGPADKAGLRAGDVILQVAGRPVPESSALPRLVASTTPGQAVPIVVWRDGAERTIEATPGSAPNAGAAPASAPRSGAAPNPARDAGRLGLTVTELPPAGRRALGVDYGLVVQDVKGPNADAGLQPGDVIVGIGPTPLTSFEQFQNRVAEAAAGSTIALRVRRGEGSLFVPVQVGA